MALDIQTTKHVFFGDVLQAVPEIDSDMAWEAMNNSDIAYGNNAETMLNKNDLEIILRDIAEEPADIVEKALALIPDDVLISLGC